MPIRRDALDKLRAAIARLPDSPGVYLFEDTHGQVLYVGKAKSLRHRVGSYFQPSANLAAARSREIDRMIRHLVVELRHVPCASEQEAIRQEARLIQACQPQFNIAQKNIRSGTFLSIRLDEPFPRVQVTFEPSGHVWRSYGPFSSSRDLKAAMPLLQRAFRFRSCDLDIDPSAPPKHRPCLLAGIGKCCGPCDGCVAPKDYQARISRLRQYLEHRDDDLRRDILGQMKQAAGQLNFEHAAALRDQLACLDALRYRRLLPRPTPGEMFFAQFNNELATIDQEIHHPDAESTEKQQSSVSRFQDQAD